MLDCGPCQLKQRCCLGQPAHKVLRSIHKGAWDVARHCQTGAYVASRREQKKAEMLFAHLKRIPRLDQLRLRDSRSARDEFRLTVAAQNLRKPARLIPVSALSAPVGSQASSHPPRRCRAQPKPTRSFSTRSMTGRP